MPRISTLGKDRLAFLRLQPGAGQEPLRAQVESLGSTAMLPRRPAAHRDRRTLFADEKKDLASPEFSGSRGLPRIGISQMPERGSLR
ncbi:hypothetical protein A7K73_09705 [Candidatus Methylacidiphilum fumarolicum]|nr:hypothetical protein A7K73_09705 [Candidatus Methylacidiphilum fumarolicum]TFE77682.1 hypothetical protein A7D33_00405 [Candidatus Methylacidiphilum fumarolicum]